MKLATVCMVKNEESVIGRMINSVAPITDLFVFTDTGSSDNTKEVIKKECEKVGKPYEIHETEFVDFGTSRTETVQKAIGKADYLLLLDADMTIENHGFDVNKLTHDGYHVFYTGDNHYAQLLLVSGNLDWKYYGKTHEYIYAKGMGKISTLNTLKINHLIDGSNRKDKFDRDIKLLHESIKENPKDRRAYFYLAESYRNNNQPEEAIEYYRQRIAMGGWKEEIYYSIYQLGRMLAQIKEYDQARLTLMDAWEFRPQRLESIHALSVILRETKKFNQAILFLYKALNTKFPKDDVLFVEKPIYNFLLRFEYSISLYYAGHKKEALKQCNILINDHNMPQKFYDQTIKNRELIKDDLERDTQFKKKNPSFNKKILYISAFTKGTQYETEVKKLRESFEKFGLDYIIFEVPNMGSWVRNTQEKPKYIFRALEEYNCPIVWVDADAEILDKPKYFHSVKDDIQFHTIKEWNDYLTGTLFINNNRRVKEFLSKWIYNCEVTNKSSQKVFIELIKQDKSLIIGELPAQYVKIFDNGLQQVSNPVIVHNQASRRFKKEIPRVSFVKDFDRENRKFDTISVIGNGPFSSDLSDTIDNSYVIRCNNFQVSEDYKGIGSKVNLNLSSLYNPIIPKAKVDYPILGAHPISSEISKYSDAKGMYLYWNNSKHDLLSYGNNVLTYNEADTFFDWWIDLADKIGAFPTTGMVGILLARFWGFEKIILSGFNFFTTEKTHYWKEEKISPSSHHKTKKEKDILKEWIDSDNVEYVLDEETKKSLSTNKNIEEILEK